MALEKHVTLNDAIILVEKLFGKNKKSITKKEVEQIMKEQKLNPKNTNIQNEKIFNYIFTWDDILRAFGNKNEITINELCKSIVETYSKDQSIKTIDELNKIIKKQNAPELPGI